MKTIKPKGILVPIGGGAGGNDILERICKETHKRKPLVCYITVATSDHDEVKQMQKNFAADIKTDVEYIHFDVRSDADQKENLEKINRCNCVFIGGGNQLRLTSLLGGTKLMQTIADRYYEEDKFVVAGSSAGAAAMSNTMVVAGSSQDALVKGELKLTNGLDLINNVFIDTHFTERGRFGRLIQAVAYNPGILGLGLSTDTGAVIYKGEEMEIVGYGLAIVVDGTEIDYSNITEVSDGDPLTVQGLKMHVLGPGRAFSIRHRKLMDLIKT
ncbi:MAG: cyanophycinase [Bacteroidia bacterium]